MTKKPAPGSKPKDPQIEAAEARIQDCRARMDKAVAAYRDEIEAIKLEISARRREIVAETAPDKDRNLNIWRDKQSGMSNAEIAEKYKISYSRVLYLYKSMYFDFIVSGIDKKHVFDGPLEYPLIEYAYGVDFEYFSGTEDGYRRTRISTSSGWSGLDEKDVEAKTRQMFEHQAAAYLGKRFGVKPWLFSALVEFRARAPEVCAEVEQHLVTYKFHPLLKPYYNV